MKKFFIISLIVLGLSMQCFAAAEIDFFDFFGPLPYNGSTLDKMTISVYTYQNMDSSSSSTFFHDNLFLIGMPLGVADIRFEGLLPNGSDPYFKIGTVFPFWIASLQAGFMIPVGSSYNEINMDLIFGNPLFNWGVGLQTATGSSNDTYLTLKIAKDIDLGVGNVEGKLSYTKFDTDPEIDVICKARLKAIPAYVGISNYSAGSSSGTLVMLGAYFTM